MRFGLFLGVLLFIALSVNILSAQTRIKKWDGGGGDNLWTTEANWEPDGVPTDADSVVLDNTYVSGSYDVIIPRSGKAICKKLVIGYAGNQNTIRLILFSNATNDALKFGDGDSGNDDFVIDEGGIFINASYATSGATYISRASSSDIFRVKRGGKYVHVTRRSFSDIFPTTNSFFEDGSITEFNLRGSSSFSLPISGRTYGNCILARDSGTVPYTAGSFANDFTVLNDFIIKNNASLTWSSGGTGKVHLKGNFIVDGVCNINREVIFSGSSPQTITGSGQLQVNILKINNSAGVSLGPSIRVTINSTLDFEDSKLTIDPANAIKVISSITRAGAGKFVDGKLTYPVSSTGSKKWETGQGNDYLPVTIDFTSLSSSGDVTVSAVDSLVQPPDGPLGANKVLRRYFKITQTGLTSFSADLTLSYSDDDLQRQGITNESSLRVFQWDGASWRELTVTSRDLDNNTITVTGVTSFSDFVISGTGDAPLPVTLKSFIAKTSGNKIKLVIETSTELDGFLGFNIYRGDEPSKIDLVASYLSDERLKAKGSQAYGAVYEWEDINVKDGQKYYYKIGLVSSHGEKIYDKIIEAIVELPKKFVLYQNYPNPFNPLTTIEFDIAENVDVRLEIFNLRGQKVAELINGKLEAGRYSVVVDFKDMPSGVYFYILRAGNFVDVKKMVLMK